MNQQTIVKNSQPHPSYATGPTTPSEVSEASSWDESQIQAVIRYAGATGRSPEEFFNKKWKQALCR